MEKLQKSKEVYLSPEAEVVEITPGSGVMQLNPASPNEKVGNSGNVYGNDFFN